MARGKDRRFTGEIKSYNGQILETHVPSASLTETAAGDIISAGTLPGTAWLNTSLLANQQRKCQIRG